MHTQYTLRVACPLLFTVHIDKNNSHCQVWLIVCFRVLLQRNTIPHQNRREFNFFFLILWYRILVEVVKLHNNDLIIIVFLPGILPCMHACVYINYVLTSLVPLPAGFSTNVPNPLISNSFQACFAPALLP